jgi:hypothetical protein
MMNTWFECRIRYEKVMADGMTPASLEGIEKATPECGVAQYISTFGGQPSQQPKNPAEVSRLAPKRVCRD